MFKNAKTTKGENTRRRIFENALRLFRERGFEATTMRDIATAAGQSLGAAYHYFPGKEAIVLAYYDRVQDEHARRVGEAIGKHTARRDLLAAVFHSKLDILADDRPLMGALLRFTGVPTHPLSFLGEGTRNLQLRSMALFREAMAHEQLPDDLRAALPTLLWSMHMGLLLYFLYDGSPRQRRTRALTDGAIDLVSRSLVVARQPLLKPLRRSLWALLEQAGLLASDDDMSRAVRSHEGSAS